MYIKIICINGCKICLFCQKKKNIFFLFYISISVYFTSSFYLNNIFLTFFLLFHTQPWPPTLTHKPTPFSMNTFPFFFSHSSSFFSSFFFFIILSIHLSLSFPNSLNKSSSIYRPHQPNPMKGRVSNQYQNKTHKFYHQFQQTHKIPQA